MGIAADILLAWRHPRQVIRRRLSAGVREDRAIAIVMGACAMVFLAQWPRMADDGRFAAETPMEARLGGALLAWLFLAPLLLYLIAALSRVVASMLGGQGSWFSARMALFWALLSVAPLWLLNGLIVGLTGPGLATNVSGFIALAAFVFVWISSLIETESGGIIE